MEFVLISSAVLLVAVPSAKCDWVMHCTTKFLERVQNGYDTHLVFFLVKIV
jgi:hypothetical protein